MQTLASTVVDGQHVGSNLSSMLDHNFSMPLSALRKGVVYTGHNARLRSAVRTLLAGGHPDGRPFKIAVLGGSISWGHGSSRRGENDWFAIVSKWFMRAFPSVNLQLRNGCVPATASSYMTMCLDYSSDNDTDIIFAEYNFNDGFHDGIVINPVVATFERLIRRILSRRSQAPMIIVQVLSHGVNRPMNDTLWRPFHHTSEGVKAELAQYYDLPVVSLRNAAYRLANFKKEAGYNWEDVIAGDNVHPRDQGCRMVADLVVWLFQQTGIDLMLYPFGTQDVELLNDPLPPPMMPGNEIPHAIMCAHNEELQQLVLDNATTNFHFVNEGTAVKPRKGYLANTTGAVLTLQVDTDRRQAIGLRDDPHVVSINLAYLRSYQHMGQVFVRCISGCTCRNQTMDAHHEEKHSQLYLGVVKASQHARCTVSITVLSTTSSGEHKFRLGGVMVSQAASSDSGLNDARWGMQGYAAADGQLQYARPQPPPPAVITIYHNTNQPTNPATNQTALESPRTTNTSGS